MQKYGKVEYDGDNLYGYGSVRLAPFHYKYLVGDALNVKSILDIGCGDGVINEIVDSEKEYLGVDIGAGCYDEVDNQKILYIRDYQKLIDTIKQKQVDITLLMNVLEHTLDFVGLFECALNSSKEYCLVTLPNEENIHQRLNFLMGRGIDSHTLDMVSQHVNKRHLWLVQVEKAEKILTEIAERKGFVLFSKAHYIAYPNTRWKRVIYKIFMKGLSWNLKSRNFAFLFKKIS